MNISDSIFSKSNQSKLFEQYKEALADVWGKDINMINYCMKNTVVIIPLSNNCLVPLDKETIKTEFFFGYSDIGQGRSYDENNKLVEETNNTLVEYFMNHNLEHDEAIINSLIDASNDSYYKIIKVEGYDLRKNSKYTICRIHINNPWSYEYKGTELTTDEINNVIEGYKIYKEKFEKRLETYLKKYGTSKLSIRTYWIDE